MPPNLTVPIFDLVDVIFQLQDGGWIRYWIMNTYYHSSIEIVCYFCSRFLVGWLIVECVLLLYYRRKAFWVAKQVLQLGMGDALEDWLIQKIQRFRKGSSMASAINRLEQVLMRQKCTFLIVDVLFVGCTIE